MNQEQQLNQALHLTISELTTQLANETTTKNMLAVQLTEANKEKQTLTNKNAELMEKLPEMEALLDVQTASAEEKGE